jgi:hypothetical protein
MSLQKRRASIARRGGQSRFDPRHDAGFLELLQALPTDVRIRADKTLAQLKINARHPL